MQKSNILTIELTNSLKLPFENHTSEFKFTKSLKSVDIFKESYAEYLSNEIDECVSTGNPTLGPKAKCLYIIPLEFQIKKFLELPNVLHTIEENLKSIEGNKLICNFINGEVKILK